MSEILQDTRHALRQLARNPTFAVVAILTLAVGIGATTAIFSIVDAVLLREPPLPEPDRIVTLWQNDRRYGNARADVAPGNFIDWRERTQVFEALAALEPFSFDRTGDGPPEVWFANLVTEGFFEVLRLRPILGRTLTPGDHQPGSARVVLLSAEVWQRDFGGDPGVVGRSVTLDDRPYTIVGVLPSGPALELGLPQAYEGGVWVPHILQEWHRTARGSGWWNVVGRLRPGATLEQARAEMDRVATALAEEHPSTNLEVGASVIPLRENIVGAARPGLLVLLTAVGLILLIACVNVANLLLARGTERERELAVRAALGAGRRRLAVQLLTESALLAGLGSAAGLLLALWGVDMLKALSPGDLPRIETVAVDLRVVGFALAVTFLAALGIGTLPAAHLSRPGLREALGEARGTAGLRRGRTRAGLIVAETAIALTLLIGAGLVLRSFVSLLRVDPGFARENVLALQVFAWDRNETPEKRVRFFEETLSRIEALPGVRAAGAVTAGPFLKADIAQRRPFTIEGQPAPRPGEEPETYVAQATPGYFRALSIPLLRGRAFTDRDRIGSPPVAVINETMWRQVWPGEDPVGKRVRIGESPPREIVGVVGDVRHTSLEVAPRPEIFLSHAQTGSGSMTYFVRTTGAPAERLASVQQAIWSVDPLLAFYETATADALISRTLVARRFLLVLLTAFAGVGLLIATIGIYGVVHFAVQRRTREVGIRVALGARRRDIVGLVLRQGMTWVLLGVALGFTGALALARLLAGSGLLFGVTPRDELAYSGAALVLVLASLVACYVPARRASAVDPIVALRQE